MDKVATHNTFLRVLIVVAPERRNEIARKLSPLHLQLVFVGHAGTTSEPIREDDVFQVALLPATLSDTDWWESPAGDPGVRTPGHFSALVRRSRIGRV
jgi:hypothetical protein